MKYALISDIHVNLPALEAVLADINDQDDVDAVYHLGDLVGYAPWLNEVVALLRERQIPGIAGNYDSTVAADYKHCGCRADTPPCGRALSPELRVDPLSRLTRDQACARRTAVPSGRARTGWPHLAVPDGPRSRGAHPQHPLLD